MYQPIPEIVADVQVGGIWYEIAEATSSGIAHAEGDAPSTSRGISRKVPAKTTQRGKPSPGTFSWDLNPGDPSAAILALEDAAKEGSEMSFREDEGDARELYEGAKVTTVELKVEGGRNIMVLAGGAHANMGSNLSPFGDWDRGLILVMANVGYFIESILSSTTAQVSRIGGVAGNIVTRDATAFAAKAGSNAWKLYEYAIRRTFKGAVTAALGHATGADSRTKTISGQLSNWETITYLLANDA